MDDIKRNSEQSYAYDNLDRLKSSSGKFDYETWNPLWNKRVNTYTNEFEYNVTGKILRKNQQNTGLIADTNTTEKIAETTYDWTYEYTGPHPNAVTKAGTRTMAYDLNGNMTSMTDTNKSVTRTLTWNEENRLKQTTDASTTLSTGTSGTNSIVTTYEYDAAGTRVLKKGKYGTVQYVSDNYTVRNKDLISKHVFAGNTRLVSKVVMNEEKSGKMTATEQGSYYYHADHLGSSSVVTDGSGKFYEQIEYFPYGETWVHNKATSEQQSTPYKFTSKELDEETGLYYYGARYYDAKLSRWISADPALEKFLPSGNKEKDKKLPAGGIFKSSNLGMYIYSSNNPVVFIDPDGNWDHRIHYGSREWGGTLRWAQDKGISSDDAQKIASANNNTDTGRTSPIYGKQGHHFNKNNNPDTFPNNSSSGTSGDSRIQLSEQHLEEAVKLWKLADQFESSGENKGDVQGLRDAALEHLGMGMHALQDVSAHSDEFVGREPGAWSHHKITPNSKVPERGKFADDPRELGTDGKDRFKETKQNTDNYIDRFIKDSGYKVK